MTLAKYSIFVWLISSHAFSSRSYVQCLDDVQSYMNVVTKIEGFTHLFPTKFSVSSKQEFNGASFLGLSPDGLLNGELEVTFIGVMTKKHARVVHIDCRSYEDELEYRLDYVFKIKDLDKLANARKTFPEWVYRAPEFIRSLQDFRDGKIILTKPSDHDDEFFKGPLFLWKSEFASVDKGSFTYYYRRQGNLKEIKEHASWKFNDNSMNVCWYNLLSERAITAPRCKQTSFTLPD